MSAEDDLSEISPRMREPLHVGRPNIGNRSMLLRRIEGALDRRWLSNDGPLLREFEAVIQKVLGVKHVIACCNGTAALEIAIRALELKGEVIIPSYTFIATAHALYWQGIKPVFADIIPETHNISPDAIRKLINKNTSAIMGVHLWGRACDIHAIQAIAEEAKLKVIYDASHAFACSKEGKMIGNFGNCEVFSFHATKFINSLEGGAITTNDDTLAEKVRLMRNFGFNGYDNVVSIGANAKMNEFCAAMGLTNLEALEEIVEVNRRNYEEYAKRLKSIDGVTLIDYDYSERNNFQYIVVEIDLCYSERGRDSVVDALHKHNIIARKYFWPGCHRMQPYRSAYDGQRMELANTEAIASRVVVLPTGQCVTAEQIAGICDIIKECIASQ
jgi:dTDP-4-amino-4,6-dideoxygalactose transaminase